MENNNQMVEAFNKVIADSGIQIELWRDYAEEKWKAKIDTSVHDKQIRVDERAKVLDEVEAKLLANGFIITHHALDVWHEIAEQLKEQKDE